MPPTTSFRFGDVVLVPFPFTDQTGVKKRPALVVSSSPYHRQRRDLIIMAVTGSVRTPLGFGEFTISAWKAAGLLKPSVGKPVLATMDASLVLRRLGRLREVDRNSLVESLKAILG